MFERNVSLYVRARVRIMRKGADMAATIRDIKEQTGLSLATISKYLNGGNVNTQIGRASCRERV